MAENSIATVGREDNDSLIRLTQMAFGECGEWTEEGRFVFLTTKLFQRAAAALR